MVIKKKASHYKLLQEELRRTTKALAKQTKAASQPKVVRATAQLKVHHLQQALKATKEASKEALKTAQQDLKSVQQDLKSVQQELFVAELKITELEALLQNATRVKPKSRKRVAEDVMSAPKRRIMKSPRS